MLPALVHRLSPMPATTMATAAAAPTASTAAAGSATTAMEARSRRSACRSARRTPRRCRARYRGTATRPDCRPVAAWRPPRARRPDRPLRPRTRRHSWTIPRPGTRHPGTMPRSHTRRHHRPMPRTYRQDARQVAVTGPADAWTLARSAARGNALPRSRWKPARPPLLGPRQGRLALMLFQRLTLTVTPP
jgi:hypothetical protein